MYSPCLVGQSCSVLVLCSQLLFLAQADWKQRCDVFSAGAGRVTVLQNAQVFAKRNPVLPVECMAVFSSFKSFRARRRAGDREGSLFPLLRRTTTGVQQTVSKCLFLRGLEAHGQALGLCSSEDNELASRNASGAQSCLLWMLWLKGIGSWYLR